MAERRGLHVLLNDPPRGIGVSLDEIAQNCDIITFHVPLSDNTHYLCNADFLRRCKPGALIINAARGGVVDEEALLRSGHPYVLDTWEGEPHISAEVLAGARLASMHIAGYSQQGKRNATQMCLTAIAERFSLPEIAIPAAAMTDAQGDTSPGWLRRITERLKAAPDQFEPLRRTYPLR
jgi:erythronate-4-phosphate dehydrogenase